jgi:hypothetical protein
VARFYLDADIRVEIARILRERGHDAVASKELGFEYAQDEEQLLTAARREAILVTHNRDDFRMLHRAWHLWSAAWRVTQAHAGIVVVPQQRWPLATEATELIQAVQLFGDDLSLRLLDWRPSTGWYEIG